MRRRINKDELLFIEKNYKELGVKEISKILNRKTGVIFENANKFELRHYSKKEIEDAVIRANNLAEAIKNLKLFSKGANYITIRKYIKQYNINTSHFLTKRNYEYLHLNKKSLEEILVENSSYNRGNLKKRLYDDGLKKRECELCGQGEEWQGRKMSLILDHINGINNDNRFENLRIVCPNCNATLDTHCGKNKTKEKREIKKKIKDENKTIINFNRTKVKERPSVETLKEEVINIGYTNVGKKYKVSDTTIRKWMKDSVIKINNIDTIRRIGKPKCLDCGNKIGYESVRCKKCKSKNECMKLPDNTEQLKLDFNLLKITNCAKKYNVSRKTMKRWVSEI